VAVSKILAQGKYFPGIIDFLGVREVSYIRRELDETNVALYTVIIEDSVAYMDLDMVEYKCCGINQYTDLTPVPPGKVYVSCNHCHNEVVLLEPEDFKIQLVPIDEVYDHVNTMFFID
jgi:hypothetical protein